MQTSAGFSTARSAAATGYGPFAPKPDVVRGMGGKGRMIFDNCVSIWVKLQPGAVRLKREI
jgi:hypothetical protein